MVDTKAARQAARERRREQMTVRQRDRGTGTEIRTATENESVTDTMTETSQSINTLGREASKGRRSVRVITWALLGAFGPPKNRRSSRISARNRLDQMPGKQLIFGDFGVSFSATTA